MKVRVKSLEELKRIGIEDEQKNIHCDGYLGMFCSMMQEYCDKVIDLDSNFWYDGYLFESWMYNEVKDDLLDIIEGEIYYSIKKEITVLACEKLLSLDSEFRGAVIQSNNDDYNVGYYGCHWMVNDFKPCNKKITLTDKPKPTYVDPNGVETFEEEFMGYWFNKISACSGLKLKEGLTSLRYADERVTVSAVYLSKKGRNKAFLEYCESLTKE